MEELKFLCFTAVLIYASAVDIKTHNVQNRTYIFLFLVGLLNIFELKATLYGLVLTGIPLLTVWLFSNSLGAGDVKLSALCGFVLTGFGGLVAVMVGMLTAVLIVPIYCKAKSLTVKTTKIPLVPYISIGCITVEVLRYIL